MNWFLDGCSIKIYSWRRLNINEDKVHFFDFVGSGLVFFVSEGREGEGDCLFEGLFESLGSPSALSKLSLLRFSKCSLIAFSSSSLILKKSAVSAWIFWFSCALDSKKAA